VDIRGAVSLREKRSWRVLVKRVTKKKYNVEEPISLRQLKKRGLNFLQKGVKLS